MKSMQITRRWLVLLALLLSSVAAAVMVSREEAAGVVAAARPTARHSAAVGQPLDGVELPSVSGDQLARLNARRIDGDLEPLFDAVRKPPAAVKPVQAEAAPAEQAAPPLPFRYLGQMIDDGRTTLFLSMNARNLAVNAGETIDGTYRVDSIENGVAVFTYLPMKQKQTLPIGERS